MPTRYPGHRDYAIGNNRWFTGCVKGLSSATSQNGITTSGFAIPLVPAIDIEIDAMGIYSTGSSGDAGATDMIVRFGIYDANSDHYPDSLLFGSAAKTVNTTGIQSETFGAPIQLTEGTLYWLVSKKQNTPSGAAAAIAGVCSSYQVWMAPYKAADNDSEFVNYPLYGGLVNGALPDPFPAGAAPAFNANGGITPFFSVSAVG